MENNNTAERFRQNLIEKLNADIDIKKKLFAINKYDKHIRIRDMENTIGSPAVHYEVFFSNKGQNLSVEIHFESKKGIEIRNSIDKKIARDFPKNVKWIDKNNAKTYMKAIGFENNLLIINERTYYQEVKRRLLLLEDNLGDILRQVIKSPTYQYP